jgi:hypothetical protein
MNTAPLDLSLPVPAPVAPADAPGFPNRAPRALLRLEGLAMLVGAVAAYVALGERFWLFAALFLVPDLSLLGYLRGPRVGAIVYNAGHSLIGPLVLASVGVVAGLPIVLPGALVWVAHIGFDRALGYGLKYGTAFADTHLGRL